MSLETYKQWMPLKDMADAEKLAQATLTSVLPTRTIPNLDRAKAELAALERPQHLPAPAPIPVIPELTTQKKGWSWINHTLLGNKPRRELPSKKEILEPTKNRNTLR